MDHKRKAGAANGAPMTEEERQAKRRKLQEEFDLTKAETVASTTAYGLDFVEQMRRTADKSGRLVATYFEALPPKEQSADYYKRTRMPISLQTIEIKLNNGDFNTLSELESYFKRMISNAKEYFPKTSQVYEDAERVRKALSNYMTRYNPAYHTKSGYTALPTPLPPEEPEAEEDQGDDQDADGEPEDGGEDDEDAEGEDEDDLGPQQSRSSGRNRSRRSNPPTILLKTKRVVASEPVPGSRGKPDHEYEDVPYKGLTFQQAQEKIVEEMLRKKEDDDDLAYFTPYINLPPRSLKDYYQIIVNPLSIKKLQKHVVGVQGRGEATGISEFRTWNAFEEKASLLWKNAFQYNEDGSDIAELAKELKAFFLDELRQAKAVVKEPPKVKINVTEPKRGPKIVLRTGSADSTILPAGESGDSQASDPAPNEASSSRNPGTAAILNQLERTRSVSGSVTSPNPSLQGMKKEDSRMSPAILTPQQYTTSQPRSESIQKPQGVIANGMPAWNTTHRLPGRGIEYALIRNVKIQSHPSVNTEFRIDRNFPAQQTESQPVWTVSMQADQNNSNLRVLILTDIPAYRDKDRYFKLYVMVNGIGLNSAPPSPGLPLPSDGPIFDAHLQLGLNRIEVHMVASLPLPEMLSLPKGIKPANGVDTELEIFTIIAQVKRH